MLVLLLNKCSNRDTKDILHNILKVFLPLHESSFSRPKHKADFSRFPPAHLSVSLSVVLVKGPRVHRAGGTSSEQPFPLRFGCCASVNGATVPLATLAASCCGFCPSHLHNETVARDLTLGGDSVRGARISFFFMHCSVRLL